jgi:hypothetical protein
MPRRAIITIKVLLHVLCLIPLAWLLHFYTSGALALNADPVNYITHFTGDWAIYLLLASLAITPLRRLSPKIAWLIRLRRLVGLYAFFYATPPISFSSQATISPLSWAASAPAIPVSLSRSGRLSGPISWMTSSSAASSR